MLGAFDAGNEGSASNGRVGGMLNPPSSMKWIGAEYVGCGAGTIADLARGGGAGRGINSGGAPTPWSTIPSRAKAALRGETGREGEAEGGALGGNEGPFSGSAGDGVDGMEGAAAAAGLGSGSACTRDVAGAEGGNEGGCDSGKAGSVDAVTGSAGPRGVFSTLAGNDGGNDGGAAASAIATGADTG